MNNESNHAGLIEDLKWLDSIIGTRELGWSEVLERAIPIPNRAVDAIEALEGDNWISEFKALKDRLDNGIKYDEEHNIYTVRWTARELEEAQKQADEIYNKINWQPLPPKPQKEA